jgi:hypothetical protein
MNQPEFKEPIVTQPASLNPLAQMITGYWVSQMVHVAARLRIADLLAGGPRSTDEIAALTKTHAGSLYRLLRALASVGVFSEGENRTFSQTALSENLRSDVPGSSWAMAVMMGGEHYRSWGDLFETVRTGETAFDRLYGKPIFEYLGENPEEAKVFDAAMTSIHGRETPAMLDAYDLSGVGVLADVGGGNGSNLVGVLGRYPAMKGILFDLPHVVDRASANLKQAGLSNRCEIAAGDFFASVPVQADAYFLRHIIHDWDDAKAERILRNIRKSMPQTARLLLVEHVFPPGDAPSFGKLLDLNMMVLPGGLERTEEEFRRLYERSGFRLTEIVSTDGDLSVIVGEPA